MPIEFIIYAAIYRLGIIAAGFGCVFMGYRLFVLGVMPREGSDVDAQAGEIRLTLKNAAPGTCFAAFGVFMIITMLVQGNPEYRLSDIASKEGTRREVNFRSENGDVSAALKRGGKLEATGQLDEAIKAYAEALINGKLPMLKAAGPLRAIAAVYHKQGRHDEAIAYARLTYQIDPDNASGLALIARIQISRGNHEEAIKAISRAADIEPAFVAERDRMKEQTP